MKWNLATFVQSVGLKFLIFRLCLSGAQIFYGYLQAVHEYYNLHEISINFPAEIASPSPPSRKNGWTNILSISVIYIRHVCWDKAVSENRSHLLRLCQCAGGYRNTNLPNIFRLYLRSSFFISLNAWDTLYGTIQFHLNNMYAIQTDKVIASRVTLLS